MKHPLRKSSLLLPVFLALACGKAPDGPQFSRSEEMKADGSNVKGIYRADLYPQNINLYFKNLGSAAVMRDGDNFSAYVHFTAGTPGAWHRQAIYSGTRCPGLSDDTNKDGYVDLVEAEAAIGKMLVPLDGDLDSQGGGLNEYPTGDGSNGGYLYEHSGSFDRILTDLQQSDENPGDEYVKVGAGNGIGFVGKVVVVMGTTSPVTLPPSVQGNYGLEASQSIPVACGYLWKTTTMPEEFTDHTTRGHLERRADSTSNTPTTPSAPGPAPTTTPSTDPSTSTDSGHHDDVWNRVRDWFHRRWHDVNGDHPHP